MKLNILPILLLITFISFGQVKQTDENIQSAERKIDKVLNNWHKAAGKANFDDYFSAMTHDAVFIGTDATENWTIQEFKKFSKPYFDSGKAWDFTAVDRNIFVSANLRFAWFDELLDTHMGICRGSGIMTREKGKWKIQHYVLSMAIPNENVDEITLLKKDFDQKLIETLNKN